ncbi:MAG: hypothetical protein M1821_000594 [Bathelium mastoideum]|nr:MAG: hypothetical protein M1821_000594 [Bathelium mastoideum]
MKDAVMWMASQLLRLGPLKWVLILQILQMHLNNSRFSSAGALDSNLLIVPTGPCPWRRNGSVKTDMLFFSSTARELEQDIAKGCQGRLRGEVDSSTARLTCEALIQCVPERRPKRSSGSALDILKPPFSVSFPTEPAHDATHPRRRRSGLTVSRPCPPPRVLHHEPETSQACCRATHWRQEGPDPDEAPVVGGRPLPDIFCAGERAELHVKHTMSGLERAATVPAAAIVVRRMDWLEPSSARASSVRQLWCRSRRGPVAGRPKA